MHEAGVHLGLPLVEMLHEAAGDRALVEQDEEIRRIADAGIAFLDFGAEFGEAGGSPRRRLRDFRINLRIAEGRAPEHPEAGDPVMQAGKEVLRRARLAEAVGWVVAGKRAQHESGVGHGAGHRPEMGQEAVMRHRRIGHEADGRLDAENACEGRRYADRAAAVAALGERSETRRNLG